MTVDDEQTGTRPTGRESGDLDELFGDPRLTGSFDYSSIVADDDARRMSETAEAVLDEWGAGAEFVPAALGGRWVSTEDLVRRWRPVFRRDPALGLGHGLTSLVAALNVWVAGDESQRVEVAARLLRGERIAVGFHEFGHGSGLLGNECVAERVGDLWFVHGSGQVINNVDRAESVLIIARTSREPGSRSHSLLLWYKDAGTRPYADTSRRVLTAGMRGCRIGEADFRGLPIPVEDTIGAPGMAAETALKASQVSRAVIPALAVATVDASLHLAVAYGSERSLYGGRVLDLPHARALLAGAIADFLVADAFSSVVVRALHLAPTDCLMLTAASNALVPQLLMSVMDDLALLFGSTFYARVPPYDVFEKFLRDVALVPIIHDGSMASLLTVLPNLPDWLRTSRRTAATDPALFRLGDHLDELLFDRFTLGAGAGDSLGAALHDPRIRSGFSPGAASQVLDRLAVAFDHVRDEISELEPTQLGAETTPHAFGVAHRLTLALAAAAWAGVCAEGGGAVTSDPLIQIAALQRIEARLAGGPITPLDPAVVDRLLEVADDFVARNVRFALPVREDPPQAAHRKEPRP